MMSSQRFCWILLPFLAAAGLHAQAPSPEEVEALMARSGFQRQMASLPPRIEQGILMQNSGLDPKRVAHLKKAMAKAFAADRMRAQAREFLQTKLLREEVEQVAQWHSSPLGTKIRELEFKTAVDPETLAAKQGDLAKIVGAERLKRIERIESALGATEGVLMWYKHAGTSFLKLRQLLWGMDPVDQADRSAELKPTVERMGILSRADVLRDLTVEELDRYVVFVESPAARHWHRAAWGALDLILAKGAEEVMAAMAGTG